MTKLLFAYEWDRDNVGSKSICVSNGVSDVSKYNISGDFLWYETFPEINNQEFVKLSDISSDRKYIYNIPMKNTQYFFKKFENGFSISDRLRKDVLENKAIILFDYHFEGHILFSIEKFNKLVNTLNLPKNRIVLLHGDYNVNKFKDAPYLYQPVDIFSSWVSVRNDSVIPYNPNKLFVSYNKMLGGREHRIYLLANLHKHNLVQDGYISVGSGFDERYISYYHRRDRELSLDDFKYILNNIDTSPDRDSLTTNLMGISNLIDLKVHENSFLSLVSETLGNNQIDFFSEKIYKPLSIGHPFILNSSPRQLYRLHNMGFKTFARWWSEDYDLIDDVVIRIHEIIKVLEYIKCQTPETLIRWREEMKEILTHNMEVFRKLHIEVKSGIMPLLLEKYL
jgi:hypothetical protein